MIKKFPYVDTINDLTSEQRWDLHFIELAELVGKKSKDPSTKVGAIIVDKNNRIISTGYNGLPQKLQDTNNILLDRDRKLKQIIHAEENAIIFAKQDLTNCVIYVWPMNSCSSCASKIIQAGIKKVVTITNTVDRWKNSFNITKESFKTAGVEFIEYDSKSYNIIKGRY
ncbi:MAG: deoxycytidylate deaminase [Caudoviricetes sp.]|nr:MAG: deoxycytidylate deaminase [Caudoviricetes sp.]